MKEFNFSPFPKLATERLALRQLEPDDDREILILRSDDKVNKYIDRPKQITIDQAREFIHKIKSGIAKDEWIYWAIAYKNERKLRGTICLWNFAKENTVAETGYELQPECQGKGIMTEALAEVITFGFGNMNLKAIEAYTHPDNTRSTKLLEKCNFERVTDTAIKNDEPLIVFTLANHRS